MGGIKKINDSDPIGLLGNTKLESTVHYLGIEVDDALELSEALDI
jgi:hypothetical protein